MDMATLFEDLSQPCIWSDSWGKHLAKFQHYYLGSGVAQNLNMPNNIGELYPWICVEHISDLGVVIDYSLTSSVQVSKAVSKVHQRC